jgi:hypothetical protein
MRVCATARHCGAEGQTISRENTTVQHYRCDGGVRLDDGPEVCIL